MDQEFEPDLQQTNDLPSSATPPEQPVIPPVVQEEPAAAAYADEAPVAVEPQEATHGDAEDQTEAPAEEPEERPVSSGEYTDPYRGREIGAMPIGDYQPVHYSPLKTREPMNKGVRVFAGILAAVILLTASCTVGYLAGRNRPGSPNLYAETTLDLAERPEDTDAYTTAEVYDMVNKSVVGITVYGNSDAGRASGVIYTEDGYVITNDHIYSEIPNAKFKVTTYDGRVWDAVYVAGDTRSDLAVLKLDGNGFYPATFGNSDSLIVGETVLAIGRPTGVDENSLTRGVVSLKQRRLSINTNYSMKLIQTDAPINPGNSGGALTNLYGQVVGITSSKLAATEYEGICFAIPTTTVKKVVESLIANGSVTNRAKLGISYYEVDEVTKEINRYPSTGVLVGEVSAESDLYGKLDKGDLITAINDQPITQDDVILDVIEACKPGDTITLSVYKSNGSTAQVSGMLLADAGSSSYQSGNTDLPDVTR